MLIFPSKVGLESKNIPRVRPTAVLVEKYTTSRSVGRKQPSVTFLKQEKAAWGQGQHGTAVHRPCTKRTTCSTPTLCRIVRVSTCLGSSRDQCRSPLASLSYRPITGTSKRIDAYRAFLKRVMTRQSEWHTRKRSQPQGSKRSSL